MSTSLPGVPDPSTLSLPAPGAALEASERRLRVALDAARLGSFEWDIAGGRVLWSAAIERMHGIPEGSFEGTFDAYLRDVHPDDRERVLATMRGALARADAHHLSYRIVRPDGAVRWLEAHGQFETDADGRPTRLIGVCRDVTEQREAEAASHFQRYILELVTSNATSALFMMDRDGHPTFMNDAAVAMTGFTLDEIRGVPLHYAVHHHHPDGSLYPLAECPIDRALPENSDVRAHEDVFIRKDGSFFPVVCAASPIVEDGVPVGTVVEVRDVTAERAARDSLRALTDSIPVQVWTARPDGGLDFVSASTAAYFGAPEAALLGDGWVAHVHPDDVAGAAEGWTRALATGEPYQTTFRIRRADGEYRWHLARALPVRDVRGAVTRWFGSNTDIEEQKAAERARDRALAEAEAARTHLQAVVEQAPAAMSVTEGPEHVTVSQNAISRRMIGGRSTVGRRLLDVMPDAAEQGYLALLDQVYRTGEPFVGNEMPVRFDFDEDGAAEERFFNLVYQPLRDAGGAVYGILTHAVDVSEQVHARREIERKAEELARLTDALERSNRDLDQFAYVASHDLKAPLRGIANLAQWIEEDVADRLTEDSRGHMRLLKGRVHRMEALIDGVLTYSRAARTRARVERVDTGALVAEVVDLLAPAPNVVVDVPADMPAVETERVPLQQVFMNLIANALKHGRSDAPRVRVTFRDSGADYEFAVSDDGPGIAPEFHERIWGIFQTLEARDKVEGTGIGLAVVRKIVESRGGRAWVESAPGDGATFRFTWPRPSPAPLTAGETPP